MKKTQKVSYKFNEELISSDGVDINEFEKNIKETFAKYRINKNNKNW